MLNLTPIQKELGKLGIVVMLLCGGLWYVNSENEETKKRVTLLEKKLLDCYDSRIRDLKAGLSDIQSIRFATSSSTPDAPTHEPKLFIHKVAVLCNRRNSSLRESLLSHNGTLC